MSARLMAMQEENDALQQQIQNYELKQRLAALTADLIPKSQDASHVQSRSQDASSNTTGPDPFRSGGHLHLWFRLSRQSICREQRRTIRLQA